MRDERWWATGFPQERYPVAGHETAGNLMPFRKEPFADLRLE
jgi:hypothetical protein